MSAITDELRDYFNEYKFRNAPSLKRKVGEIADRIDYHYAMYASHTQATIDEMSELLRRMYQDMYDSGEYVEPYEEQLTRLGVIENAPQRLQIKVHDTVSGICPPCPKPDIEFVYATGVGRGHRLIDEETHILRCRNAKWCDLRAKAEGKTNG